MNFSAHGGKAGFRPVGHIVWQKNYASSTGFLQYRHEQAYLLIKGNPDRPAKPIADVRAWEYTGNKAHPTEKAVSILTPLIRGVFKAGARLFLTRFQGPAAPPLLPFCQAADTSGLNLRTVIAAMPGPGLPALRNTQPERRHNMDTALKNAAILANLSALRMTLAGALERAEDAENAIKLGEVNQAIGAAMGLDTMLQTATALYGAALALHRSGRP